MSFFCCDLERGSYERVGGDAPNGCCATMAKFARENRAAFAGLLAAGTLLAAFLMYLTVCVGFVLDDKTPAACSFTLGPSSP